MIQEALLRSYRDEFARHAALTDEEQRRRRAFAAQEQKQREEKEARDSREAHLHALLVAELASPAEIAAFTAQLDSYDAATVEAMMANEEALDKVREDLKIMLDKAYVLEDGRRVFKTEDGARIFDEQGQEVTELDPELIEDERPRWEEFLALTEREQALIAEREDLARYQDKLDQAREAADQDGMTKAELHELERDLGADMPEAVRTRLDRQQLAEAEMREEVEPVMAPTRNPARLDMPTF